MIKFDEILCNKQIYGYEMFPFSLFGFSKMFLDQTGNKSK